MQNNQTEFNFEDLKNSFSNNKIGMKPMKAHLISLIVTGILWVGIDYVTLPVYNLRSMSSIFFVCFILGIFTFIDTLLSARFTIVNKLTASLIVLLIGSSFALSLFSSEMIRSQAYRDQINIVEVSDFNKEFETITIDNMPIVDHETAIRLGDKQIGKQAGLGSQFSISNEYTLISTNDDLLRVSPLQHQDIFKWIQNKDEGIPAYIKVNVKDPNDVEMVMLDEGIVYSPSSFFSQNLFRHIRFTYRTDILSDYSFEIDDEGNPYWVVSVIEPQIGWFGGMDATGVIVVDPFTGEMNKYGMDNIPEWIDRVQPTNLAWSQIDNWGYYVNGIINTFFGQKDMIQTTDGYNYINIDGETHIFSGLTSVGADQSINGFALINLRDKSASYIKVGGADEYSAMASAEGQVQHLQYSATFPILLSANGRATYFVALKDAEHLVKMYAFVDVSDYSIVGVGDTVDKAYSDHLKKLKDANKVDINDDSIIKTIKGTITSIDVAISEGYSVYYMQVENQDQLFVLPISLSSELPLSKIGDIVEIEYLDNDESIVIGNIFDNLGYDY